MKVRLKAPAEQAAGRQLQELVYYIWRGVQYARGWVQGSNPASVDQVLARAAFSAITKRWETLSAATREGWDTWAAANTVVDSLGREVRMPALAAYVRVNSIKHLMSGSYQDTAPTTTTPSPVTAATGYVYDNAGPENTLEGVEHSISSLTGMKLLVKQVELPSPAVAMSARKGVLFAGYVSGSFLNLAATGQNYLLASARSVYVTPAQVGVSLQIVNAEGLVSLPYLASFTTADL